MLADALLKMKRLMLITAASLAASSCFGAWPLTGLYRCGGGCPDDMVCDDDVCCRPGAEPACPTMVPDSGVCAGGAAPKLYFVDKDGDGYGNPAVSRLACSRPIAEAYVDNHDDCDDSSAEASPVGSEKCDGLDNNCNGRIDEGQSPLTTYYRDVDGDGYGDSAAPLMACQCLNGCVPQGYADKAGDCGPMDAARHPGAPERCNGLDDDCNNTIDDGALAEPIGNDCNEGGLGLCAAGKVQCRTGAPVCVSSYTPKLDICDGVDNDCDGEIDEQPDCGGPKNLITAQGTMAAQDVGKALSFAAGEGTNSCIKDWPGSAGETWNRPNWTGGKSTHHVWYLEAPAGKTWDLSKNPRLYLEFKHTMTSGADPAWDASKLPVLYFCGVDNTKMLRLVHIPGTLLGPLGETVRTTVDFGAFSNAGWNVGASTGLDLTKVKRLEVLVKPAPNGSSTPTFTITFAADAGFKP